MLLSVRDFRSKCRKIKYRKRESAEFVCRRWIEAGGRWAVYKCNRCEGWHLTSHPGSVTASGRELS